MGTAYRIETGEIHVDFQTSDKLKLAASDVLVWLGRFDECASDRKDPEACLLALEILQIRANEISTMLSEAGTALARMILKEKRAPVECPTCRTMVPDVSTSGDRISSG